MLRPFFKHAYLLVRVLLVSANRAFLQRTVSAVLRFMSL
jgi:hypothetical protein